MSYSYSIYFDSFLKTRKGKVVPFYDRVIVEKDEPIKDNSYCIYRFHPEFLKQIERKFKLIYEGNKK